MRTETRTTIGLPRFSRHKVSIHFEVQSPDDESYLLENYGDNATDIEYGLDRASLKPVISLDEQDLAKPDVLIPLGRQLWLDIEEEGKEARIIPIRAGGYYELMGFGTLNAEKSEQINEQCASLSDKVDGDQGMLPANVSHSEILSQYLETLSED